VGGRLVGEEVGTIVGDWVGRFVGELDRIIDDKPVGLLVGVVDGDRVGSVILPPVGVTGVGLSNDGVGNDVGFGVG